MKIPAAAICAVLSLETATAGGREVVRLDPPAPIVLAAGRSAKVQLSFVVRDGYHVQANPASADYLKPVVVEVAEGCGIVPSLPIYPPAEPYRLQGADADLATYSGRFTIVVVLSATEGRAAHADCALRGTLQYQACDARTCLAPATLAFALPAGVR